MKSFRDYLVKIFNGMAMGLFASLIIGLIMIQIGEILGAGLLVRFGQFAQYMMGPAIGAGVAMALGAPSLVVISAVTLGALGGGTLSFTDGLWYINVGEPVGAFLAALIGTEIGRRVSGKTSVDIILVPFISIVSGGIFAYLVSPYVVALTSAIGEIINQATHLRPVAMGIIVSVVMGMVLTLPFSSAALGISLGLEGLAAGAAAVGCACNMVGFAVGSFKENGFGGLVSQGLGTSMLQIPNIIKKPVIWLPSIITSAILGPISTTIIPIRATAEGSGMGTSGLVGIFSAMEVMGNDFNSVASILLMMVILPAILSYIITKIFRARDWIKDGDMKLKKED